MFKDLLEEFSPPKRLQVTIKKAKQPYSCYECKNFIYVGELHSRLSKYTHYGLEIYRVCSKCSELEYYLLNNIYDIVIERGTLLLTTKHLIDEYGKIRPAFTTVLQKHLINIYRNKK